jgi:hypothetical protein
MKCWGANDKGQLGDGNPDPLDPQPHSTPVVVSSLSTAASITTGVTHTCASLTDNTVLCWGDNGSGQLGNGNTSGSSALPNFVKEKDAQSSLINLSSASGISAGGADIGGEINSHTCALISNGTIKCWGDGHLGQIGSGLKLIQTKPVLVQGL